MRKVYTEESYRRDVKLSESHDAPRALHHEQTFMQKGVSIYRSF